MAGLCEISHCISYGIRCASKTIVFYTPVDLLCTTCYGDRTLHQPDELDYAVYGIIRSALPRLRGGSNGSSRARSESGDL